MDLFALRKERERPQTLDTAAYGKPSSLAVPGIPLSPIIGPAFRTRKLLHNGGHLRLCSETVRCPGVKRTR